MRHYLRILSGLIVFSSLLSCKKVIEIDLPPTDPKIVVNSFFTEGSRIKAHISKSIGILENIIPVCTNATVVLREENTIIDTLIYQSWYYYSDIIAEASKKYSLEVIAPGMETVFCEDIIPEKTMLQSFVCTDSVLIDENGFVIYELELHFQDLPGPSFYEVELFAKDTVILNNMVGINFMKNTDPVITSTGLLDYDPKTLIFSDKLFNGRNCTVKIYFSYNREPKFKLKLYFRSVSESYFKYKEKQFAYLFSLDADILRGMGEPVNLYSNITNGYGIFAGYSTDEKGITFTDK